MTDGVFEAVRQVLSATTPKPTTALLLDTANQIRRFRGLRKAEQESWDMADIEVGHMQFSVAKLEQALKRLKRIPPNAAEGLMSGRNLRMQREPIGWVVNLERIKGEIETRTLAITKDGGAPKKHSPTHIGLAVMGALKRGNVPMRNWQSLTAKLLENAAELPHSEATTGARYAREWMAKSVTE